MFNRSLNTTIGFVLFVLFSQAAPVLAQGPPPNPNNPNQVRVTGTCPSGSSIRVINADGSVVCQMSVTSVSAGSGLNGGTITTSGTISVNPAQVQSRVTGTCATGSAIRVVDQSGNVTCQSVPDVIIDGVLLNTAIGSSALSSNTTGHGNTASGYKALFSNTTGNSNTASSATALQSNTTGSGNTSSGVNSLLNNTTGNFNTASGDSALQMNINGSNNTAFGWGANTSNTTGNSNTASGSFALASNTTGSTNTAIGFHADVISGNLTNATAIGAQAVVNASNKIRLGDTAVTVIEGEVDFTFTSDQTKKENFQPVDGEAVLEKLRGLNVTSWNYIGHDPKQFRHYGPMGQEFFAAFGHDGIGTIGTPTTLTSGDVAGILMSAVQAMEKRTTELRQETERLKQAVDSFKAENAELRARLEKAERTTIGHVTTSSR